MGCPKPYKTHKNTPKLTTGTSLHSSEKRSSCAYQSTDASSPNQETLTSHWSNPTHREQTRQLRGTMNFQPSEIAPQHSNLNKMKRQRNIQQVKEHDKILPNQMKEEEIGSLFIKKFRIMIVKMIKNLENKMKLQINRD